MRQPVLFLLVAAAAAAQTRLYVSPTGNDGNDGTRTKPFATLERARDAARRAPKPAIVAVASGSYRLTRPLELTRADSGIAWQGENARITGGISLKGFAPVEDPAVLRRLKPEAQRKTLVLDLPSHGIHDWGGLVSRGFSRPTSPAHAELFFQGKRMTVARWPNNGFARISEFGDPKPEDDGHGRKHGRIEYGFTFTGDRPSPWLSTDDVWAHGYWSWDWANTYEAVASFDRTLGLVKTKAPYGLYGFRSGQRFYFLNILEELDAPGEYYLDRKTGKLYFWPPAAIDSSEIVLNLLATPLVTVHDASDVSFAGFTFESTRANGIEISGGARVAIRNSTIRNVGNHAVVIRGGERHSVDRCHIYQTGDSGVILSGGDRSTLTASHHSATNNHIHHVAEWTRTYNPAVKAEGVGQTIANNHIHDSPHTAILLTGNDHVIELNEIHHVCLETGDVGAFYMGRDYSERGVIVRHNYFHHTGGYGMGSMGVYLDDCASGALVYGNIFYKTSRAVFIGGGRDNAVENNIFVDCDPAVHLDGRGLDPRPVWQDMVNKTMRDRLEDVRYLQPPYITRYPLLASIKAHLEAGKGVPPEGNRIVRNICVRGRWLNLDKRAQGTAVEFLNNLLDTDPRFVDEAKDDFRLLPDSPAWQLGFREIPVHRIGPR